MLLGLLVSVVTFGQTTIASQSFETVPSSPNWAYTKNGGTVSTTNTGTPTNQRIRTGAKSLQFNSESGDITFNDISVSSYSSIKITLRISSISGNSANGADVGDYLRVFTKLNNDSFKVNSEANSEITVKGDTNARWGFNASGVTTTAGVNTVVSGTSGTNQGTVYSTLTINIPDGTSKVGLRINALNDDSNEFWCLDDIEITGQTCSTYPTDPVGSITVSANPACGSATLTYPSGYYWQTSATGVSTSYPTSSNYTVSTTGTYYVRNYNGTCWSTGALSSGVVTIKNPVSITNQPVNASVFSGSSANFSVTASNVASYQWQVNKGSSWSNISGANLSTYAITNVNSIMNGYQYRCILTSISPCTTSLTSNAATLSVTTYTPPGTQLKTGDLMLISLKNNASSGDDVLRLVNLVNIAKNTEIIWANATYETGGNPAANERTDKWFTCIETSPNGNVPYLKFTYTGTSSIPAGSTFCITTDNSGVGTTISVKSNTGTSYNSFTIKGYRADGTVLSTNHNAVNISTSRPDSMFLMQGDFIYDAAGSKFVGTVLSGVQDGGAWYNLSTDLSSMTDDDLRISRKHPSLECASLQANTTPSNYEKSFITSVSENVINSRENIIVKILDYSTNWDDVLMACPDPSPFTITSSNSTYIWKGTVSNDWFNCNNWSLLSVPDATTNVEISSSASNNAVISYNSPNSDIYYDIANCKNIEIKGRKVQLEASPLNILNVYGDLKISGTGALDMDDSNAATTDGELHLYGNWTNNVNNSAFSEGNGTVYFEGSSPQVINNVTPEGTEVFYNVILNNNFDTSISNDLQANGNLTVSADKTLSIASNDYVQVAKNITNNGSVVIADKGSLVQTDDSGTYSGAGSNSMSRKPTNLHIFDYVYWTSPQVTTSFATIPNSRFYEWKPDHFNGNGYGYGNWFVPTGTNFSPGTGYIFRVPSSLNQDVNFSGSLFNNGVVNVIIKKGGYTLLVPPPPGINAPINRFDDNWNLVGNPYPSAIDAVEFLTDNAAVLENGSVCLWRHINTISNANPSPYYQTFGYNYSGDDYVTYNGTGAVPYGKFDGKIAAGQAFFVTMKDDVSVPTTATMQFNNSQRSKAHNNSQFFKTSSNEKHRIWLDLIDSSKNATGQLVGYISNATNEDDFIFESKTSLQSGFSFYSLIDNTAYSIQGRQLPFDENDNVPLGMIVPAEGKYSIAIANVDGRFTDRSQAIYLEDKNTAVLYDLTKAPYEFTVSKGITNNRFVLRYTDKKLSNTAVNMEDNEVAVFVSQDVIKIDANENTITEIDVYNVLGQKLYGQKISNLRQLQINTITKNNQGLIVKGTLENGKTFTRKIIF